MFFEGPILGSFLRPPVSVTGTLSKRSPRCHSPPRALPGRPLGATRLLFLVFLVHFPTHFSSLSRTIPRHDVFTDFAPCLRNKHDFEGPSPQNPSLWASPFCFIFDPVSGPFQKQLFEPPEPPRGANKGPYRFVRRPFWFSGAQFKKRGSPNRTPKSPK